MADYNEAEQRAFEFGPDMRLKADLHCGGSLVQAFARFSTPPRVAQHEADRASIRPEHRMKFIEAIRTAGNLRQPG